MTERCCHGVYFEMYRCIRTRLRLGPAGGAYSTPRLRSWIWGRELWGMETAREGRKGKEGERKGRGEMEFWRWEFASLALGG